ncbi:MAG: T9SS type A sorting domain-containing protein [Bacteroidota bacterium]
MKKIWISLLILILSLPATAQSLVRVMHYNLLQFGNSCGNVDINDKYGWLSTVLNDYQPDIFTVNELNPNIAYSNGIRELSFNYTTAVEYAAFTNFATSDIVNQCFYNQDKFALVSTDTVFQTNNGLRDINVYTLYHKPTLDPGVDTTFVYCIVSHLKAGSSSSDQNQRTIAAGDIMRWIRNNPQADNLLVMGDFNVKSHTEGAFQEFINHSDPGIALDDPLGLESGWGAASQSIVYTQSTRSGSIGDCGVAGGVDDRFDFILTSQDISEGLSGVRYVENSYLAYGNGGNSFNTELQCGGSSPVSINVCAALKQVSDHLPVVMELDFGPATSIRPGILSGVGLRWNKNDGALTVKIEVEEINSHQLNLEVLDLMGAKVAAKQLDTRTQTFDLDLQHLPSAVYVLRLLDQNGRQLSQKFIW